MTANIKQKRGVCVIDVQGSLTVNDADHLEFVCSKKLKKKKVVFNLKDLSFVGSSGISIFYKTLNNVNKNNSLKICCVSSEFQRIFDSERLDFSVYNSEEEALASF